MQESKKIFEGKQEKYLKESEKKILKERKSIWKKAKIFKGKQKYLKESNKKYLKDSKWNVNEINED